MSKVCFTAVDFLHKALNIVIIHFHWLQIKCFIQNVSAEYAVDLELQISLHVCVHVCVHVHILMQCFAVGSHNNKIFVSNKVYIYLVE